jgi:hypothetical protein
MKLRSGQRTSENNMDTNLQDRSSAALQLNEVMIRYVIRINNEEIKTRKIQHILDFYVFLKQSVDIILVPKYQKFIENVIEKTREHMNTLEDEYFQEMITSQQKNTMFECYYTLSTVRRLYKKYLCSLRFTMTSSV